MITGRTPRRLALAVTMLLGLTGVLSAGLVTAPPARAAIDAQALGARYDGTASNITFRVYSSTATRIAVYLYSTAAGAQEKVSYVLTESSDIFAKTVSVARTEQLRHHRHGLLRLPRLGPELALQHQLDEGFDRRLHLRRRRRRATGSTPTSC